ncbi:MAG: protein kinase family protein [Clostridia bacterium]|nr:protein kinase family protein [Clostridia bacterium]
MEVDLENKVVKFDITKDMRCIKKLGQGGTGSTYLFIDESVDMLFAIKKYTPQNEEDREEYFERFVDEIKILFKLSYDSIVRIYSYYLYPKEKTGYIQMEYIDGDTIEKVDPKYYNKTWNDYFIDIINAFNYLHSKGIIHRDIRPSNFMINKITGEVKIIDFGFGKKITESDNLNSICLNWPATIHPEEVITNGDYTYATEIYYLGEMFKNLVKEDSSFLYNGIINKMLEYSPSNRYSNYEEIKQDISNDLFTQISFSEEEKETYSNFADDLCNSIVKFTSEPIFVMDFEKVRTALEKIIRVSSLETYVQNNNDVILSFVTATFRYKTSNIIKSVHLINFYKLLMNSNTTKRNIIIDSIAARLKAIHVEIALEDDDLPF